VVYNPPQQNRNAQTRMNYTQRPMKRLIKTPARISKAPFRKSEIDIHRKLGFDLNRNLPFRKKGVVFRSKGVVFRPKSVVFRTGSIRLKSASQQRGKWQDYKRWKREAPKKQQVSKGSKLKGQKSRAVHSPRQPSTRPMKGTAAPQRRSQLARIVTPLKDELPTDPTQVLRADSTKKMAVDLNNVGVKHYNNGNYSIALNFFTEAIRYDPYLEVARRNQQVCYGLAGRGQ